MSEKYHQMPPSEVGPMSLRDRFAAKDMLASLGYIESLQKSAEVSHFWNEISRAAVLKKAMETLHRYSLESNPGLPQEMTPRQKEAMEKLKVALEDLQNIEFGSDEEARNEGPRTVDTRNRDAVAGLVHEAAIEVLDSMPEYFLNTDATKAEGLSEEDIRSYREVK